MCSLFSVFQDAWTHIHSDSDIRPDTGFPSDLSVDHLTHTRVQCSCRPATVPQDKSFFSLLLLLFHSNAKILTND